MKNNRQSLAQRQVSLYSESRCQSILGVCKVILAICVFLLLVSCSLVMEEKSDRIPKRDTVMMPLLAREPMPEEEAKSSAVSELIALERSKLENSRRRANSSSVSRLEWEGAESGQAMAKSEEELEEDDELNIPVGFDKEADKEPSDQSSALDLLSTEQSSLESYGKGTLVKQGFANLRVLSDANIEKELAGRGSSMTGKTSDFEEGLAEANKDFKNYDHDQDIDGRFDQKPSNKPRSFSAGLALNLPAAPPPPSKAEYKGKRRLKKKPKLRSRRQEAQKNLARKANQTHLNFVKEYLSQGKPTRFWPKQGYFKNTYLGGDLSYQEELRSASNEFKRIMNDEQGFAWMPPLDPPTDSGMTLSAKLSHSHVDHPQRVILQLGLKGSEQYGWRRPALNLMVVVDPQLLSQLSGIDARQSMLVETIKPILNRLNVADQVGLSFGTALLSPRRPDLLKEALIQPLKAITQTKLSAYQWQASLKNAGEALNQASADPHRAPGAQAIIMLCASGCVQFHRQIESVAHRLNLDGTLTSVIDHSHPHLEMEYAYRSSPLWKIAAAGHGGFWLSKKGFSLTQAINNEFDRFSRVVARLLRLSIKLGDQVELIEVMGSEMLNQKQKAQVKAREKAMDQRLSTRLGIKSDRGDDDEGVQVVIPAFYGGDSHLIHLALWVKKPGAIAEIQLKYKDMVQAKNASYAEQVTLPALPSALTLAQKEVLEGANHHLLAAKTLQTLKHKKVFNHLPSLQHEIRMSQQKYNEKELELMSRAQLGRPQHH